MSLRAGLLVTIIGLVAFGGASAFYSDDLIEEAVSAARTSMMWTPIETALVEFEGDEGSCCNCTKSSAKWVMDHVIDYLKDKCNTTECPFIKEKCEKAAAHPEVAFGYLLGKVRPVSLGYAWCNGKGECAEEELHTMEDELYTPEIIGPIASEVIEDGPVTLALAIEEDVDHHHHHTCCKGCIHGTAKGVMGVTVGKVIKFCIETEDAKFKKMCKMAFKHPKVTFGFLVYHVRPGEWACGYCFGKGSCGRNDKAELDPHDLEFEDLTSEALDFMGQAAMEAIY